MPRQVKVKRSDVVHILQLQQHEIDTARQRLATAKSQAIAASTNLKSAQSLTIKAKSMKEKARTMMEAAISAKESADEMGIIAISNMSSAQSQYDVSQKELQEAEKCLANAELRLQDIDQQYGGNKRRKVSTHPQGNTTVSDNSTVNDQETEHGESEPTNVGGTSSSSCPSSSNDDATHPSSIANHSTLTNSQPRTELMNNDKQGATAADAEKKVLDSNDDRPETQQRKVPPPIVHELKTSNIGQGHQNTAIVTAAANYQNDSSMSDVVQIEVQGCGMPKINGTYLRVAGAIRDGAPVYRKEVSFAEDYVIYRDRSRSCDWFIGHWYIGQSSSGINFPTKPCYESPINVSRIAEQADNAMLLRLLSINYESIYHDSLQ